MLHQLMNSLLYQRRREFILRDIGSVYKGRNENELIEKGAAIKGPIKEA